MSQVLAIAGLIGCLVTGMAIAVRGNGAGGSTKGRCLFDLVLGMGLGVGLAAASATIEASFDRAPTTLIRMVESGVGLLALLWLIGHRRTVLVQPQEVSPRPPVFLTIAIWFLVGCAALLFGQRVLEMPHGDYDAVANWNQRASMLYREPLLVEDPHGPAVGPHRPLRAEVYAGLQSMPHPDYPPLLPHTIARVWRSLAVDTLWVPPLLGFLFAAGTVGVLLAALRRARSRAIACIGGCVLLGTPLFPYQAAGQIADVPAGFYYLCTVACMSLAARQPRPSTSLCILAGMAVGSALLVKNEGELFAAAFATSFLVLYAARHGPRRLRRFFGVLPGMVPFVIAIACFRAGTAPNELLPFHRLDEVMKLALDGSRWREGLPAFANAVGFFGKGMLVLVLLLAWCRRRNTTAEERPQATVAIAVILAFLLALLVQLALAIVSPYGTRHHIETTQVRLVLQWWPSLIFASMLLIRDPWQQAVHARGAPATDRT